MIYQRNYLMNNKSSSAHCTKHSPLPDHVDRELRVNLTGKDSSRGIKDAAEVMYNIHAAKAHPREYKLKKHPDKWGATSSQLTSYFAQVLKVTTSPSFQPVKDLFSNYNQLDFGKPIPQEQCRRTLFCASRAPSIGQQIRSNRRRVDVRQMRWNPDARPGSVHQNLRKMWRKRRRPYPPLRSTGATHPITC